MFCYKPLTFTNRSMHDLGCDSHAATPSPYWTWGDNQTALGATGAYTSLRGPVPKAGIQNTLLIRAAWGVVKVLWPGHAHSLRTAASTTGGGGTVSESLQVILVYSQIKNLELVTSICWITAQSHEKKITGSQNDKWSILCPSLLFEWDHTWQFRPRLPAVGW